MLRLEEIKKDFKTDNNVVNVLKGITIQFRKKNSWRYSAIPAAAKQPF